MVERNGYAAIRKATDDGHEWMDMETYGFDHQDVQRRADQQAKNVPGWAKANPIVRISKVVIKEVIEFGVITQ